MAFSTSRFASMAVAAALFLAACGSDEAVDASKDTVADDPTTTVEVTETTVEETTTTTEAETTTTTVEETTTTTAAPVVSGPADGVPFADADGLYSILISPEWTEDNDVVPNGFQLWFTGVETPGFAENVNILTQNFPGGVSAQEILDGSIPSIETQFADFELIRSEVVAGTNHPELGLLEYTATQSGVNGRFLQIFGSWNDTLVVFTGSTDSSIGEEGVERLLPYALTLGPAS